MYSFPHTFLVPFSLFLDLATKSPLRFSAKWRSLSVGYGSPAALTSISGRWNHSTGHLHGHRPVRRSSSPLPSPSRLANYEQPKVDTQEHRSSGLRMENSAATATEQGDQPGEEENQSNRDLCQRLDSELVTFCGNDTESCFLTAAKCNGISDCVNGFDESVEMCGKLPGYTHINCNSAFSVTRHKTPFGYFYSRLGGRSICICVVVSPKPCHSLQCPFN